MIRIILQSRLRFEIASLMFLLFTFGCDSMPQHPDKIHILIFSGQNNHAWEKTTLLMQEILQRSKQFEVEVANRPDQCTAEIFSLYDVIISNWNTYNYGQSVAVGNWPEETKKAFLDFIQNGGGHIMIHAGGSSFYDWPDYHRIVASWGENTGHGVIHSFPVTVILPDHPIVKGIETFEITDELWHNTSVPENSIILMTAFSSVESGGSGKDEPVLLVSQFGKGRCVNFILGHDETAMSNPGWQNVLLRCTEWTVTGKTLIPLLEMNSVRKLSDGK